MSQIELGVVAVDAARGEDDPMAVAAPVVPRVSVVAVDFRERPGFHCVQVEQPLVGLFVPDGETAIVAQGEEQKTAVVGRARMVGTLTHLAGVEDGVDLAYGASGLRVKAHAADVILDVFIVRRDVPSRRGDEVECASVGREHRVVLVVVPCHHRWVEHDLMRGRMIDEHV